MQIIFFSLGALVPFLWGKVADALANLNSKGFIQWVTLFFTIECLQIASLYLRSFQIRRLEIDVEKNVKTSLYRKFHSMSYENALNIKTGDAIHRILSDVSNISPLIINAFSELIGHTILIVIIIILMFSLSPFLAVLSITFMCIYAVGYYFYQKRTPGYVKIRQQAQANFIATIEEGLDALYSVRVQGLYSGVMSNFINSLDHYFSSSFIFYKFTLLFQGAFSSLITFLLEMGIIGVGAWLVFSERTTVGTIISFSLYINWLVVFVHFLSSYATTVEPALVSLGRIDEIFTKPDQWTCFGIESSAVNLKTNNAIEVKHLDFSFTGKKVFDNLNLSIPTNKVTIIKAASGRGKSTLLNLFLKIYATENNSIFIDGEDINGLSINQLLCLISVVEQEPKFFGDSLISSIAGGDKGLEHLLKQTEGLGLRSFLENLLSRENTKSKFSELSGGERKRLGMIRGLLKESPILILDEPTAFLDNSSAYSLIRNIRKTYPSRTIIIFSHDPIVDTFADKIIEL